MLVKLINGHGSNHPLVEQVGRQANLQTNVVSCSLFGSQLVADYRNSEVRESGPGGCAHACELETPMYLSLDPDGVPIDRVRGAPSQYITDISDGDRWQWTDLTLGGGPATIIGWTSSFSRTGTI
jgi:creatinine amidohydrolase